MANQTTWTPDSPHPLVRIITDTPQDNLSNCGYTTDNAFVRPGSRLQIRYGRVIHVFEPLEAIQQQIWTKHGDHPFVHPYGPSLLDQYPHYASTGFVRLSLTQVAHVTPDSTLHIQNGYIFKVTPKTNTD